MVGTSRDQQGPPVSALRPALLAIDKELAFLTFHDITDAGAGRDAAVGNAVHPDFAMPDFDDIAGNGHPAVLSRHDPFAAR